MADIPHSIWSGTFTVFGVELRCHRLSDGRAVIEAKSMDKLFEVMESGSAAEPGDLGEFTRWQRAKDVTPE